MSAIPVYENDAVTIVVATSDGQTDFDFDFLAYEEEQVFVTFEDVSAGTSTDLTYPDDFSVSGVGNPDGGSISLTASTVVIGDKMVIYRSVAIERLSDFQVSGDFRAETVNRELDNGFMIMQELRRDLGRSLQGPLGANLVDLPAPEDGLALIGNATNDGYINGPSVSDIENAASNAAAAALSAEAAALSAADLGQAGAWVENLSSFAADTGINYTSNPIGTTVGSQAEMMAFVVVASDAVDFDHQTAGGVRLIQETRRDLNVTVGTGGDYSTLNDALDALDGRNRTHGAEATVTLLSTFTMSEQVFCEGGRDLSWIKIVPDAGVANVTIDQASLTQGRLIALVSPETAYPAFYAENGKLPTIDALFIMNGTGTPTDRHGIYCHQGGYVRVMADAGVTNAGGSGLVVLKGWAVTGEVDVNGAATRGTGGSIFRYAAAAAVQVRDGGVADLGLGDCRDSGGGIFVRGGGSVVNFWYGRASGASGTGIRIRDEASVNARSSDAQNCEIGVHATHRASVNFRFGNASGCSTIGFRAAGACCVELAGATISNTTDDDGSTEPWKGCNIVIEKGSIANGDDGLIATGAVAHNIVIDGMSSGNFPNSTITGAGGRPAQALEGSNLNIHSAIGTGCGEGVRATQGGRVTANSANVGTVTTGSSFVVTNGGEISANNAIGTLSATKNTLSSAGIIYQS